MGFACEEDARRVLEVLPKRFGKYGLTIHPDKTRLVPFRSRRRGPTGRTRAGCPTGDVRPPGVHALLGPVAAGELGGEAEDGGEPVQPGGQEDRRSGVGRTGIGRSAEQHQTLSQKLRGHFAYYGITGNGRSVAAVPARGGRASGGSGCRAARGAAAFAGTASAGCWSVIRCRRRGWSTRCTVAQRTPDLTSRMP